MKQSIIEISNFLPTYSDFRQYLDGVKFADTTNPIDGVVYPNISVAIPKAILDPFFYSISNITGGLTIYPRVTFLRLSLNGVDAPHQAHTDSLMGEWSAMWYLNRPEHCTGGTSLLEHKETGLINNPTTQEEEEVWIRDTNNPDAWNVLEMCEMESNKLCLFPAHRIHRAEPIGGFGTSAFDGRLVMTSFFDVGE